MGLRPTPPSWIRGDKRHGKEEVREGGGRKDGATGKRELEKR